MADRDKRDVSGRRGRVRVIYRAGSEKKDGEQRKRRRKEGTARETVRNDQKGEGAGDGGEGDGQEVVLGLGEEGGVERVAGVGGVGLPGGQAGGEPGGDEGGAGAVGEGRVPAGESGGQRGRGGGGPQVREGAAVVEGEAVEGDVEEEPREGGADEGEVVFVADELGVVRAGDRRWGGGWDLT